MASHLVAVPLAILFLTLCIDACRQPPAGSAVKILVCGVALAFFQGLIALIACILGGTILVSRKISAREELIPLAALAASALTVGALLYRSVETLGPGNSTGFSYGLSYTRLLSLAASVLSLESDSSAGGLFLLFVIAILHCTRASYATAWNRRMPLIVTWAVALLTPQAFSGKSLLCRFASFVVPTAMIGLAIPPTFSRRIMMRAFVTGLTAYSLWWSCINARIFDRESEPLWKLLNATEPDSSLMSVCYKCTSAGAPGIVFAHQGMWYQVLKGGFVADYFPRASPWIVRYQSTFTDRAVQDWGGTPTSGFDFDRFKRIRYFIIRGQPMALAQVNQLAQRKARLMMALEDWALYENVDSDTLPQLPAEQTKPAIR
jgi:hypothetical protein